MPMIAMALGWLTGLGIGVGGLVAGVMTVRFLAARRVPWWTSVAAPLLLFGPAIGLILGTWWSGGGLMWGSDSPWAANVGWSLLFFFGATTVYSLFRAFLESRIVQEELGIKIPVLLLDSARWILWFIMLFVIVGAIWERTEWFTTLFTASAVGTLIIGLALQETLQNLLAGIALVTERTYYIGDWVWLGDEEGEVVHISRRTTRLRTRLNDVVTLPNRLIASGKIRNQSKPTSVHAEMVFVGAPYETPPNRVREVLRQAVAEVPGVLKDPPPVFRVNQFGDSSIEYQVKIFLSDLARLPDIKSDTRVQIWYHFHRAGISIPFPIRDVRVARTPAAAQAEPPEAVRTRLQSVALFRELPETLLDVLARGARLEEFGAGERVVQQGDRGESCYVVDAGVLAVLVADAGAERKVAELAPGDLFGEMSLLTGEVRSATVRAQVDTRLVRVGAEALRAALEQAPDLATHLAEVVTLRKEGLLEARAALDAQARDRVAAGTHRLGDLIRKFFRLPEQPPGRPRP